MKKIAIEKFTISRNDSIMEGWPDLIRLQNGRIMVFYNECVAHTNRDHSRIAMRMSDDNGCTWSAASYIGEETFHGNQWNSIRANQLSDGRVILVCDKIAGVETSSDTVLYLWESSDSGVSWSEGRRLGIFGFCSDKVRELSDGTLLLCVSVHNPDTGKCEIMAHKSRDQGKTWSERIVVAKSEKYTFIEPALLELPDGTLAVFLRENSLKGYNGFLVFSADKGDHFENLKELPITGMHRPFAGYFNDGNIFLSYREHLGPGCDYRDLKACFFSVEELYCAREFETIPIDHDCSVKSGNEDPADETFKPDQGYSAWVLLPDGTILMANYIVDDAPKAYIRGYRITLNF